MPFNMFPYSNLHELNADWVLQQVKESAEDAQEAAQAAQEAAQTAEGMQGQIDGLDGRLDTAEASLANAVKVTAQSFTDTQKAQARTNIGAISINEIPTVTGAVAYDTHQNLTDGQKITARNNINAAVVAGYVRYDAVQSLTASQKQKARENIGVTGAEDQPLIVTVAPDELGTGYECDTPVSEIVEAATWGRAVVITLQRSGDNILYQALANIDINSTPATASADIFMPNDPGQSNPTTWYRVYLAAGSPSDTVTVTETTGRFVPTSSISDQGKSLTVASNGRPAWEQIRPVVVSVSGANPTIAPEDNHIYVCGELETLTISSSPDTGIWSVIFTSGAAGSETTVAMTADVVMPDDFDPAANTRYEINVYRNYGLFAGWDVSST